MAAHRKWCRVTHPVKKKQKKNRPEVSPSPPGASSPSLSAAHTDVWSPP